ncbi:MAG: MBL fold metallo-hydrolase [Cyclobacteriaceae bacterium]|jgi:glyoxylase-like metal-dependent hydrolase (beta-lactamase superfamily II)/rhodanese-related sulfurtransferase|nr:MBL fold metallo-hydrolase [Cyclobacteriaceae bacterium]
MKIEQIYTGCLAQGAYYIESEGEAAIIDPLREIKPYVDKASRNSAKIKYVLETHFHADFVSGHIDLARATGATIVYGPGARPSFEAHIASDGEEISIGKVKFVVLHTPGHTMESTCYLLRDESGKDVALFTGDTLFIGDVGRPDLAQNEALTQEDLAGYLYDSLRNKIMPLADDIIIYPAHGAGSACGKNMARETSDTLGHQKETNYALRAVSKEQFIREVTEGLLPPPGYFPQNVRMNREGYDSIDSVLERGCQPLDPDDFEAVANETGALILDTRDPQVFAKGFIPNSINIGLDGSFAPWVGALIPDIRQEILIVAENGRESEVVTRLARVGYDYSIGYLRGGIAAWKEAGKEIDRISSVDAKQLADTLTTKPAILDVRRREEYAAGHLDGAINLPLDFINEHMHTIDPARPHYVYCASGYRSMVFISILKARGYDNLVDVSNGYKGIRSSKRFRLTSAAVPSST